MGCGTYCSSFAVMLLCLTLSKNITFSYFPARARRVGLFPALLTNFAKRTIIRLDLTAFDRQKERAFVFLSWWGQGI
jgi:hypothetical protein